MDSNSTTLPVEVNEYSLKNFMSTVEVGANQKVVFYRKDADGTEHDGTTLEEMLRVSITRLKDLNSRYGCRENSLAITHMEEALHWLNHRTAERTKRGVEGKPTV